MDWASIGAQLLSSAGAAGVFCIYMMWRENKRDQRDEKRDERDAEIQKDRIEADKALAVSMTLIAERMNR